MVHGSRHLPEENENHPLRCQWGTQAAASTASSSGSASGSPPGQPASRSGLTFRHSRRKSERFLPPSEDTG